ncbi:MAG: porin, partial [Mesorhizobium sp.]
SGARAADAVVIAEPEPMEYVRICDTYGAGFFYIPGTETCLKISGYFRYDIGVGNRGFMDVSDQKDGIDFIDSRNDTYAKSGRFAFRVDARQETELGTLQGFAHINFNYGTNTDGYYPGQFGIPAEFVPPITGYSEGIGINYAFVRLGGFLVGKTDSVFTSFTGGGYVMDDDLIPYGPWEGPQVSYTFTGGNGFSAAISLETGPGYDATVPFIFPGSTIDVTTIDSYMPHVAGGVGYTAGWGGVSASAGYDSIWEEWAIKGRVDFNATEALKLYAMFGWKSNGDVGDIPYNVYGNWNGDWALWTGASFNATEKATINAQVTYTEAEDFYAALNVSYELVNNFTITPQVYYTDNFDVSTDNNWGGKLRFEYAFGQ